MLNGLLIHARRHADQNQNDRDHNHQFDQRESTFGAEVSLAIYQTRLEMFRKIKALSSAYQSEYLVPSIAMPVDFEYTSKIFLPPQLVESGSSCTARNPHSARPVMGSTGMRRRETHGLARCSSPAQRNTFYQSFEIRRIAFAADFNANHIAIRHVFVPVDGIAHLAQIVVQVCLALADYGKAGDRQRRGGKNQQNGAGNDQFKQGHAGLR